jgi:alpha-maltose-1-phosphate synthase
MVVLEAMVAGIPTVCLDFGGPSVLIDDTCGIRVDALTPNQAIDGLYRGMRLLIEDPDLARKMGIAGRNKAIAEFSWDKRVQRMLKYYGEIL